MSFTPLMMKLTAVLRDQLPEGATVVELGNQTFDPTLRGSSTADEDRVLPLVLSYLERSSRPFDRAAIERLMAMSPEDAKPHTSTYYKALGFASYDAIDVNSTYGSLVMDLNLDLGTEYGFTKTYDLVTNNGTGEHLFNQYQVFKNMHDLTRVGGLQLVVLPFYNWMNHGFYNFNPILFADLAAANDYEIVRMSVASNVGQEVEATIDGATRDAITFPWETAKPDVPLAEFSKRGSLWPFTPRYALFWFAKRLLGRGDPGRQQSVFPSAVRHIAERKPNVNIVVAMRKTVDAPFRVPLQGMYAGANVEEAALRDRYEGAGTPATDPAPNAA